MGPQQRYKIIYKDFSIDCTQIKYYNMYTEAEPQQKVTHTN